MNMVNSADNFQ